MALAADLAIGLDPVQLFNCAGLRADLWQERALRSTAQRMLLNCARQTGKSTVAAGLAVHTALYEAGALVLLLSRAWRQSQELFRTCLALYRAQDWPVDVAAESALRLELANGSRIISLPGQEETVRSYAGVRLLIIDEASRVPDALVFSVRPMLAVSRGRLVALSTPFGTRGWWYESWRSDEPWDRYEVPATACPRIPKDFLEEEQRALGEWWYQQEYCCQFLDAQSQAFRREDIDRAFREGAEPWTL